MKITPGGSGNTKMYFENLFIKHGCKSVIGYTKEDGEIEVFRTRWQKMQVGDLIVVIEGYNRVYGVVEITSDPFDDENEEGDAQADWFYHRRKAKLIKYFDPIFEAKTNTNRDTIIEYSGEGAVNICDEVWSRVREEFIGKKKSEHMQKVIDILRYKKQIILQGPPGTGKTRLAGAIADEMIKPSAVGRPREIIDTFFTSFDPRSDDVATARRQKESLLNGFQNQFTSVNLKSMSLDAYCAGKGDRNNFCWWIETGLKILGKYSPRGASSYLIYWSKNDWQYKISDRLGASLESPEKAMQRVAEVIHNLVATKDPLPALSFFHESFILKVLNSYYPEEYFPINGKSYLEHALTLFDVDSSDLDVFAKNRKLNELFHQKRKEFSADVTSFEFMSFLFKNFNLKSGENTGADKSVITKGERELIQFHPAYSYEDFVRGIAANTNEKGNISYAVENRVLGEFVQKAQDNPSGNYVLIIDEINRANLPSVLGELIYALEYRDMPVGSVYEFEGDRDIKLPKNLYIIGTMNTADRSIGHIDYAIRRRFAFVDVLPTDAAIDDVVTDVDLNREAKRLFGEVAKLFNEESVPGVPVYLQSDFRAKDVQLGHSYFLAKSLAELAMKLNFETKPILLEYVKDGVLSRDAEGEIRALMVNE